MVKWWIDTTKDGQPICPICEAPVEKAGAFCSRACYAHFLTAVCFSPGIVEMDNLLDLSDMPWYAEGNGIDSA
jgi:hypothetical protein